MAVKIRLSRAGAKKRPYYHVVATHGTSPRDGKFIEAVGAYDPTQVPHRVEFDEARLDHWLKSGAIPTDTVAQLIKQYRRAKPAQV